MAKGTGIDLAKVICSVLFLLFIVSNGKTLPRKENGKTLSRRDYLELKRELKRLNKPGVKVIKTTYGVIYDCVDIYKQPAFDNPRLKNHTVQLQPSLISQVPKKAGTGSLSTVDIRLPDGAKCPKGTVPLQRMTIEHLIRAKSLPRKGNRILEIGLSNFSRNFPKTGDPSVFSVAQKIGGEYYGLSARFNVWAPNLTEYDQMSASQMWLVAGKKGYGFDTVEAGWMVDPTHYPDVSAYLFTYSTNDGYQTGCLDRQCRFIHVSNDIPLPMLLRNVSTYNGNQESVVLSLYKDPLKENWWLTYGEERTAVGYWPAEDFPWLNEYATIFKFGGVVATKAGSTEWPEMGSGHWAEYGYTEAAFISNVHLLDKIGNGEGLPGGIDIITDNVDCYSFVKNLDIPDPVLGRHIYFGGPGEIDCLKED